MNPLNRLRHRNNLYLPVILIYSALLVSCSPSKIQVVTPVSTLSPQANATNTVFANIQPTITEELSYIYDYKVTLISNFDPKVNDDFLTPGSGVILSNNLAFFDFDKGEITTADSADIYLSVGCGSDCFNLVITINGATSIFWFEGTELGEEGCRAALEEGEKTTGGVNMGTGEYSCLLTNEGNVVQIVAIENEPHMKDAKFFFGYKIWFTNSK